MKPNKKMRKAIEAGKLAQENLKNEKCIACNGSGRYDTTNSPKCSACNGTGMKSNIIVTGPGAARPEAK